MINAKKLLALLAIVLAGYTAMIGTLTAKEDKPYAMAGAARTPVPRSQWLDDLNHIRLSSGLPQLTENKTWSEANLLHARYMVKNNTLIHSETAGNLWFSEAGAEAAASSNLWISGRTGITSTTVIDSWLAAPFHGIAMLDPQLLEVGYGEYREEGGGGVQFGAALDVQRGITTTEPSTETYPLMFPGEGATTTLVAFNGGEFPDPLASCEGYEAPTGAPIYLQLGAGDVIPTVGTHILTVDGKRAEHCIFDETSYRNPDIYEEAVGRVILDMRDAIVILPRSPLPPDALIRLAISANGTVYKWSFEVAAYEE